MTSTTKPEPTGDEKPGLGWMYGDSSAIVDREKYLLGQKVDTNFELHKKLQEKPAQGGLGAVLARRGGEQKSGFESAKDRARAKNQLMINVATVRKEDPLVAIKVKEQEAKRELADNPMRIMKLQKIIKEHMDKKMRKMLKKAAKAERKSRDTSSSSSESETRKSPPSSSHKHSSHKHSSHHTTSSSRDKQRHNSRSRSRTRSRTRSHSPVQQPTKRQRSPSNSDSDDERRKRKYAGYGLVNVKKSESGTKSSSSSHNYKQSSTTTTTKPVVTQKPRREITKMSEEDKAKRLEEMQSNAQWRDKQRIENLTKADQRAKEEERRNEEGRRTEGVDFMKPMLASASERDTLEDRLQRQRGRVQRSAGAMETHFARR